MSVLSDFLERALAQACYEGLDDGRVAGSIPMFPGVWADGDDREACRAALREVFEEWLVAALREDDDLPEIDGVSLNFAGKRWSKPSRAANS